MNVDNHVSRISQDFLGEKSALVGESFNLHYMSRTSFIKVTRPWVRPERFHTELAAAGALHREGFPVARPLSDKMFSFLDENGKTRYVTFWERLTPNGTEATAKEAAEWALDLWSRPVPSEIDSCFSLDDFIHAAHVRLDNCEHAYTSRLMEAIEEVSDNRYFTNPTCGAFIHGDLHPLNLMHTTEGVRIIDWDSACRGPLEWDAAQSLRYADVEQVAALTRWWESKPVNMDEVFFYRRVRTLTSLSHFMASNIRPPMYHRALAFLGWEEP